MNRQPNCSTESWTLRLKICVVAPKWAPLFRIRETSLLVHNFDLLIDDLSGEPVDGKMDPITLLALHNEVR